MEGGIAENFGGEKLIFGEMALEGAAAWSRWQVQRQAKCGRGGAAQAVGAARGLKRKRKGKYEKKGKTGHRRGGSPCAVL